MKKHSRITAFLMTVLLVLSMLPSAVFASELVTIDGKLKIKGDAVTESELSADYEKVTPEGITDDQVKFLWMRTTLEEEEKAELEERENLTRQEIGKEKTYTVTAEDVGCIIVLQITGLEEIGYTGNLTAKTDIITAAVTDENFDENVVPTEEPEVTEEPTATPEVTPEVTEEPTATPEVTPEVTEEPTATPEVTPEVTEEPTATPEVTPEVTEKPTATPEVTPEVTEEPKPTEAPKPTETPEPTEAPEPTETPEPTEAPKPTETPEPTEAPKPTETPEPTEAPKPTEVPEPTEAPLMPAEVSIAVDPSFYDFGTREEGYESAPEALKVTIKNTGDSQITLQQPVSDLYKIGELSATVLQPKKKATFTIRPKKNMEKGQYYETIVINTVEGVSEFVEVQFTVTKKETREPLIATADQNKIVGIVADGYTTQSKITFTAVGGGMDNTNPMKGDVRYCPLNWSVFNVNNWKNSNYSASFGMGKAGTYNLSVTFVRQQFDGNDWVNTGEQDTKTVSFKVAEADESVKLTPAAEKDMNQKDAVKTGDTTVILPLIIALLAALACVIGVIVYRKKR